MASVTKPSDPLVDILKQIQARKTVKPEDATRALQQYKKVQEQIRALKAEIELFKNNKEKGNQVNLALCYETILSFFQILCLSRRRRKSVLTVTSSPVVGMSWSRLSLTSASLSSERMIKLLFPDNCTSRVSFAHTTVFSCNVHIIEQ